ncbi:MAG: formylmethanofuran--tetrahydromethanopterin N-formyltransferase, partial [Anaerolineae bacterium]|nr:formylmethanofuran--tetrahydromethanopterin N-formyltransferase [Anaerolineae bacterium]
GLVEAIPQKNTPDSRPGQAVLLFSYSREKLEEALMHRIGQAIFPAATSACFNGLVSDVTVPVGARLRYFGDGFQSSKQVGGRRYWRIPVADGEFVVEESFGIGEGVGGGNLLILGSSRGSALVAAQAAAHAVRNSPGVIAPFPGGICRSPSKPRSRYHNLRASTNDLFCPTLRSQVESQMSQESHCAYELVIDGVDLVSVEAAMAAALRAACLPGVVRITAGNYGGKLGPYHLHLHKILAEYP